jgi:hypothetical protein
MGRSVVGWHAIGSLQFFRPISIACSLFRFDRINSQLGRINSQFGRINSQIGFREFAPQVVDRNRVFDGETKKISQLFEDSDFIAKTYFSRSRLFLSTREFSRLL